eukprot:9319076-Heterocapsa_arctica.AAC.1
MWWRLRGGGLGLRRAPPARGRGWWWRGRHARLWQVVHLSIRIVRHDVARPGLVMSWAVAHTRVGRHARLWQ